MKPVLNAAEARETLRATIWNVIMGQQAALNGKMDNGNSIIDVPEVLEVLAMTAAQIVMLHNTEKMRMKMATGFDTAFLREHRNRERAILAS